MTARTVFISRFSPSSNFVGESPSIEKFVPLPNYIIFCFFPQRGEVPLLPLVSVFFLFFFVSGPVRALAWLVFPRMNLSYFCSAFFFAYFFPDIEVKISPPFPPCGSLLVFQALDFFLGTILKEKPPSSSATLSWTTPFQALPFLPPFSNPNCTPPGRFRTMI